MGTPPSPAFSFEESLDEALLVDSGSLQPCQKSVRTLLEILQQQPFLPAYAASASHETSDIREQLLELPNAHQTRVLVKILQVSGTQHFERSALLAALGWLSERHRNYI